MGDDVLGTLFKTLEDQGRKLAERDQQLDMATRVCEALVRRLRDRAHAGDCGRRPQRAGARRRGGADGHRSRAGRGLVPTCATAPPPSPSPAATRLAMLHRALPLLRLAASRLLLPLGMIRWLGGPAGGAGTDTDAAARWHWRGRCVRRELGSPRARRRQGGPRASAGGGVGQQAAVNYESAEEDEDQEEEEEEEEEDGDEDEDEDEEMDAADEDEDDGDEDEDEESEEEERGEEDDEEEEEEEEEETDIEAAATAAAAAAASAAAATAAAEAQEAEQVAAAVAAAQAALQEVLDLPKDLLDQVADGRSSSHRPRATGG